MIRKTSTNGGTEKKESEQISSSTGSKDGSEAVAMFGLNHKTFVMYMTHLNIALYALCYWIQIGVLPVSV